MARTVILRMRWMETLALTLALTQAEGGAWGAIPPLQVLMVQEHFVQRVTNVVFMGMGEPMLNIPAVVAAHRSLNEDLGIGSRNITISTVRPLASL